MIELISMKEGLRLLGISRSTFFTNRDLYVEAIVKVSPRVFKWRVDRLDAFIRRRTGEV